MLREIHEVKQEPGPGRRRWFESDDLDLIVWFERDEITGFQLVYDLGRGEHALTWRREGGFAHDVVDAGSASPMKNLTPLLVPAGPVSWAHVLRLFDARSGSLDAGLRDCVRRKLLDARD